MTSQSIVHYRVQWKPSGYKAGTVRGISAGVGEQLRALVQLRDYPDPRRLDLRASMRDPFERMFVKDFYLNSALNVIVLLDTSASMGYVGRFSRMEVAKQICASLAISAYRSGDAFGIYTANQVVDKDATLPVRLNRSAWLWVNKNITKIKPQNNGVDGLTDIIPKLPRKRSLVFIVSDLRWPQDKLKQILKGLLHHDVVPIVLRDPAESNQMPRHGIAALIDVETGKQQFIWLRKRFIEKMIAVRESRLAAIKGICKMYGTRPFVVDGDFEPEKLTEYFMERHA